jgi:endonuclease YncB( thermonuclease family)
VLVDPPGEVFCVALDCVKKIDAGLEQIKAGLAWHYKYTRWISLKKTEGFALRLN